MRLTDGLYSHDDLARLMGAPCQIHAILVTEAALARVQAALGIIPAEAGAAISRAALALRPDPANLIASVAQAGIAAQPVVAAIKSACAPYADWVHFGATSQDIEDTALVLCLVEVVKVLKEQLSGTEDLLRTRASETAQLVIPARTRFQTAAPTTLGAKIAVWRSGLTRQIARLDQLTPRLLNVSFYGAAGTGAALYPATASVRASLAEALDLNVADMPWHAARDSIAEFAGWLALTTGLLGKIGADLILLGQSEIGEISAGVGGSSSTMPQKSNPVAAEALVSIARMNATAAGAMYQAMIHAQERDGSALALEWLTLPDMIVRTGAGLRIATDLARSLAPVPTRITQSFVADRGAMLAEAAGFYLARHMPRSDALKIVGQALRDLRDNPGETLASALARRVPGHDWAEILAPQNNTGEAAEHARNLK